MCNGSRAALVKAMSSPWLSWWFKVDMHGVIFAPSCRSCPGRAREKNSLFNLLPSQFPGPVH
jgi:hypothetical protein